MATYRTDSLYRDTKITNNQYLDELTIDNIDVNNTTTTDITLNEKYDEKPDLLAYDLYGNAKLWWVFALFNQDELADPILDFKAGLKIKVPARFS
jgi:hypothetical protein